MRFIKNINESIDSKEVTIIEGDDWEGIYYNGRLLEQGHSLNLKEVLRKLGYKIDSHYLEENDWDEIGNNCPPDLEEVKIMLAAKNYNL